MAGDTSPVIRLLVWIFKKALKTGWLFLEALAEAGWWLLWRFIDLICLALWAVAVCSVVRTHSALRNFGWVLNNYEDWADNGELMSALRILALAEFFMLFVDYPTYLVTLIVYVTPWRCYKIHGKMRKYYKLDFASNDDYIHGKWREKAWFQFWLWVLDLFTVPFCVVVFLTGYRARHLIHKLETAATDYAVRKAMVIEFLNLLVDLPCITLALALCCTWRVPWIFSRAAFIWNVDSDIDRRINRLRSLPFHELWLLVLDVPVIAAALVCTALPWRLVYFQEDLKKSMTSRNNWNSRISIRREYWRCVGWAFVEQAGKAFCDILAFVGCVIIATAGVWRIPMLIRDIWPTTAMIQDPKRRYRRDYYKMPMRFHSSVAVQFAKWLLDIPCIVAGAVVLGTVWRANVLLSALWDPDRRGPGWGKRARIACVTQLLRLVTDVLLLIPLITVAVTGWRTGPLLASYSRRSKKIAQKAKEAHFQDVVAYKNGWAIMRQFVLLLLDLLLGLLAFVVYCTIWRAWPLYKSTKKRIRKLKFPAPSLEVAGELTELAPPSSTEPMPDGNIAASPGAAGTAVTVIKSTGDELDPDYVFQDAVLTLNFKAVLSHFGLLLVDLVAFPIGLGLLMTWRAPAVISGLAGSGDFYTFFALTIFTEFGRFLVDIPCLLWFLLMLIFRPIGSVTLLLEDSKHKRARLLRARMGEMRDIWGKRSAVLGRLDEMALACLKHGIQPAGMSPSVQRTNAAGHSNHRLYGDGSTQMGEIDWFIPLFPIEDSMKDYLATLNAHRERTSGLSDHYTHLVDQVIAIEAKRPRKIMRLYHTEYAFMARPDLQCLADNIKLVTAEMEAFDQAAEDAAKAVSEFIPATPPLWSRSTGFSTRSRSQTQWVLIQIATTGYFAFVALLLLNTVLVYRLPQVVRNVRAHWWNRHAVLRGGLLEYGKDFGALMCMLLVTCGLYRSMQLYSDITVALFEHRSWTAARSVAFFCASTFLSDIRELLCVPLRWGTYSFTAIALMWGVLVPIDLFQPTFGMAIGLIIWAVFTAFPFAFTFDIAGDIAAGAGRGTGASHDAIDGALMAFIGTLLVVLAVATRGMHRRGEFNRPPEFKFFKLNWENVNTIFSELLEFVQITALTYQIGIPMRHSSFATEWSGYFLLSFIPTDAMFYTMVALFVVWYFVASAPPVLEQVTGRKSEGRISSSVLWKLVTVLLTDTLFITMAEACLSTVRCRSDGHGGSYFLEDYGSGELECWQGSHRAIAGFSLFALFWYTVTSLLYNGKYALGSTRHDFQFAALYMVLNNLIKLAMVSVAIVLSARPMVAVSILAGLNLLALLMTWRFSSLAGYPASTAKTALVWKLGAFIGTTWANAVAVVSVVVDDAESVFPLYAIAAGWGALLVGLVLYTATRIPRSQHEVGREGVKKTLLELEARLEAEGALLTLHPQAWKAWRWKIAHVREAKWISVEEHSEMAYVQVVNEDLCCPITMEMLVDPVKTPYGHCFERSAIVHWVQDNGTCPLTRQRLGVDQLKPASEIIAKMARLRAEGREDKLGALHDNPAGLADLASATLTELGGGRWGPTPPADTSSVAQDLGDRGDAVDRYAEVGNGIGIGGEVDTVSTTDPTHAAVEGTLAAMGFAVTAEVRAILQANDYNVASTVTMLISGQAEPPPSSLVRGGTNVSIYEGFGADDGSDAAVTSSLTHGGTNDSVYAGFAVVQDTPDVGSPPSAPAPGGSRILVSPAGVADPGDPTARLDRAARSSSYTDILATGTALPPSFAAPPPPSFADVAVQVVVPVGAPPKADVPADEDWNRSWSAGTGVFVDDGDDYDGNDYRGDPRAHPYYKIVRMFHRQKARTAAARSTFDGRSALLELEQAIRYDRLAFWFVASRDKWRAAVEEASWLGLQQATAVLQRAVDEGKFHSPAPEWQLAALPEDAMQPDFDEVMLAPYIDHTNDDPATVKTRSAQLRADLIAAFRNAMEPTAEPAVKLLDTLLPVGTIDRWSCTGPIDRWSGTGRDYTVRLIHDARGKLTKVGAGGIAAAKGATLRWQEEFTVSMVDSRHGFDLSDGALKAGKGPVSLSVTGCRVLDGEGPVPKFEVTYNGSKDKAVKVLKVLCTLDTFVWS